MYQIVVAIFMFAAAIALVVGAFRPALVLPGRNMTRMHAIVLYGAATVALAVILARAQRTPEPAPAVPDQPGVEAEVPPDVRPDDEPGVQADAPAADPQDPPPQP
jgi:hypothetical protein